MHLRACIVGGVMVAIMTAGGAFAADRNGGRSAAAGAEAPTPPVLVGRYLSDDPTVPNRYRGNPHADVVHELSFGVLYHDDGPFSRHKEQTSADLHIEVRLVSPEVLEAIGAPYPHIGANINTAGQTSQMFAGLSWEWEIDAGLFAGVSLGAAVHNGETDEHDASRKALGCRMLFRESVNLGYRWDEHNGVGLLLDHISNASLCDSNEGLENVGLRYQYRF